MQINYRVEGEGSKNLFFIHGWASDSQVWRYQVEGFKTEHRIISIDLRGHGESGWEDTSNLLSSFTEDILELCQRLALKKANFIGWSIGGYVLFELFKKTPELIDSLTFITGTAKFLNSADYPFGINEPNLRLLEKKLTADFNSALEEFRLYMFSQEEKEGEEFAEAWETLKKIAPPNKNALSLGLELLEKGDFRQDLQNIDKPVLLIAGEKDPIIPSGAAKFMHSKIRDSELVILENTGHAPCLTQPERFNQILREWINRR